MKCQRCNTPGHTLSFAFKDGKPIYYCTKCRGRTKIDPVTNWFVLPAVKEVTDER